LPVEVTNISANGFWLLLGDEEHFVSFRRFPWFKSASIGQITNVERPASHHLYWPALDADLAMESVTHPERFPLVSRERPNEKALQIRSRTRAVARKRPPRASRR
jgi:uncharacterized protein DUF2442